MITTYFYHYPEHEGLGVADDGAQGGGAVYRLAHLDDKVTSQFQIKGSRLNVKCSEIKLILEFIYTVCILCKLLLINEYSR